MILIQRISFYILKSNTVLFSLSNPRLYLFSDFCDQIEVTKTREMKVRDTRLTDTIDFSRTTKLEVDFRKCEPIIGTFHGTETLGRRVIRWEEIAV